MSYTTITDCGACHSARLRGIAPQILLGIRLYRFYEHRDLCVQPHTYTFVLVQFEP